MTYESGHRLSARFVLVRRLGAGTSGEVWLARDHERGTHVALKILAPALACEPAFVDALEREYRQVAALDDPGVVRVEGLHREGGTVFIAMEHLPGGDVSQFRGRPAADLVKLVLPVAEALARAHEAGIVHRDVKSANVLLAFDGSPRLVDFGLALASTAFPDRGLGRGSLYSMSPQQAAGEPASAADDVYAFGVLLHELISGYPPFYPDITDAKRLQEQPAPPAGRYPVPEALASLVMRCIEKDPVARPDMAEIVEALRSMQATLRGTEAIAPVVPLLTPPSLGEQPLEAQWRRPATPAGPSPGELRREGFRRGLTVAALLLLLVAAGGVFFVLPSRVDQGVVTSPVEAPPVAAVEPEPTDPVDLQALALQKQAADEVLAGITDRMAALRQRAVEEWGGQAWTGIEAAMVQAARHYAARDYIAAQTLYQSAVTTLQEIERRAGEVYAESIARGNAALVDGRSSAAAEAFDLALRINPGQTEAERGRARARTLDEVLARVAVAETFEQDGQLQSAADAFREALGLDGETVRAREGLARVQARITGDAFATAMAGGFAALASGDFSRAKTSFESAGRLRPDAPEVRQALAQVEQEERTVEIARRLAEARGHEAGERWRQALGEYDAVLSLDATMAEAQQGRARVEPRATLHDELELYVTQPERLFSAPVRETARMALARANAVPGPGPVLERQMATLGNWLEKVTVPVQVTLESDNLTQVTIYRVGELGTFSRRDIELLPGRYTVVGTRPGYRDVRREIMVQPGTAPGPVVVRCEDRI